MEKRKNKLRKRKESNALKAGVDNRPAKPRMIKAGASGHEQLLDSNQLARLHRDALSYVHNYFIPDYGIEDEVKARSVLMEMSHSYLVRSKLFSDEQYDEMAFSLELQVNMGMNLNRHWMRSTALPYVEFLKDCRVLDPYESSLLFLLCRQLEKNDEPKVLIENLRNLKISWTKHVLPDSGIIGGLFILLAEKSAVWWNQWMECRPVLNENVSLEFVSGLTTLVHSASGQLLGGHKVDWHIAASAGLQGANAVAVCRVPKAIQWLQKFMKNGGKQSRVSA